MVGRSVLLHYEATKSTPKPWAFAVIRYRTRGRKRVNVLFT